MSSIPRIFDRALARHRLARALAAGPAAFLLDRAVEDLADRLAPIQAARLAVMLPAPKRFEKLPRSGYVMGRAGTIAARMRDAELP